MATDNDRLEDAKIYLDSHDEEIDVSYMKHLRWLIDEVEKLRKQLVEAKERISGLRVALDTQKVISVCSHSWFLDDGLYYCQNCGIWQGALK